MLSSGLEPSQLRSEMSVPACVRIFASPQAFHSTKVCEKSKSINFSYYEMSVPGCALIFAWHFNTAPILYPNCLIPSLSKLPSMHQWFDHQCNHYLRHFQNQQLDQVWLKTWSGYWCHICCSAGAADCTVHALVNDRGGGRYRKGNNTWASTQTYSRPVLICLLAFELLSWKSFERRCWQGAHL